MNGSAAYFGGAALISTKARSIFLLPRAAVYTSRSLNSKALGRTRSAAERARRLTRTIAQRAGLSTAGTVIDNAGAAALGALDLTGPIAFRAYSHVQLSFL
jgi:hypothetical protein